MDSLDYLNQFEAFHWLDKDAKQRIRARAAKDMVATDSGNATVSRDLNEGLSNILAGKPPAGINGVNVDLENVDRRSEALLSNWFNTEAGQKVRWLCFLDVGDPWINQIIETALGTVNCFAPETQVGPADLVAIRGGESWLLAGDITLEAVIDSLSETLACDFEYFAGTAAGSCMVSHHKLLRSIAKCDGLGRDGKPNKLRRDYLSENFHTIPFGRGNTILLARVCRFCLGAFSAGNHIVAHQIGIIEPPPSGFGRIGAGPISKSEYLWNKGVVEQVYRDWELRNGKPPSRIELQKALQGTKFVGAGSEETQKMTDKRSKRKKP
ncbi:MULTISPECIES: hypothetical protein [unclassified Mycobacterium]|uniref:hypothetical protein n=1 Tax=unclassified Mycobacterium TaxID=2642494 RepID=UPI000AB53790|nr:MULTISPECIES: hypothetical protein [unclassified Mycobacterium]